MTLPPRPVRSLALLVAVALGAVACADQGTSRPGASATPTDLSVSVTPTPPPDQRGGSLRFALGSDPLHIDPRFVADEAGRAVVDALFDSLVELDDDLDVVPAAADRWEASDDARTFTFHLAPDATFHDGTPVTSQDFVRAFNRIASGVEEPASLVAFKLAPVAGFDDTQETGVPLTGLVAEDERTLSITLSEPFAEFVEVLADPSLAPVPATALEEPAGFAEMPVGNGPFVMAEPWQHDQFIRVARYADHHRDVPLLDEVVFQIYSDDPTLDAQWSDLQSGALHFAEVSALKVDQAVEEFGRSDDGYRGPGVLDGLSSTIYYYGFNTEVAPFDDPEVRRAVSLLIDRDRIVTEVTRGTRRAAEAIVPPSIPGNQREVCDHCRFDPQRARELIGDRELPPLRLLHNTGKTHTAIAELVAADIREALGVEVEVVSQELQPYLGTLRTGEVGLFRLGWEADHASPGSYLHPLFHSSQIGSDNLTRYADAEVDALLDLARAEGDPSVRHDLYQAAEARILGAAPIAPIMYYEHGRVVAPTVRGFVYTPLGTVDLTDVSLTDAG